MLTAGIDIGSLTTKSLILDGIEIKGYIILSSGHLYEEAGIQAYDMCLEKCGISKGDIKYIVGTGYGRALISFADENITEITCHARGVSHYFSDARTVIDIGGQDSKAIRIGDNGKVLDFVMNDKCAAGTGRFLEVMQRALNIDSLDQMGELSLQSKAPAKISSMCTVFAESEVISLFAQKKAQKIDIIAGLHTAIAKRITGMVNRLGRFQEKIIFCGGVAKNVGVKKAIEKELGKPLYVPEDPQITGALGAAILAQERYQKKRKN
ncbi:MAG: 2-hydroxyglutaryl-CoA dehydratase [Candidatus Helarchaeota archaeon]|nr:2-hydroxyglutaryl-CoA dehydratase [Candidatus Helarchaeota archaeon]